MNKELQSIAEAYMHIVEAKINGVDHAASTELHNTLSAHGWKTFNPYESIKKSYSLDKNNTNTINVDKNEFTHKEPGGLVHTGPISMLPAHLNKYHKNK